MRRVSISLGRFYPRQSVECSLFHKRGPSSSFIVEVEYAFSAEVGGGSVFVVGIEIIKFETSSLLWCETKLWRPSNDPRVSMVAPFDNIPPKYIYTAPFTP
jgi:hypothetical protein